MAGLTTGRVGHHRVCPLAAIKSGSYRALPDGTARRRPMGRVDEVLSDVRKQVCQNFGAVLAECNGKTMRVVGGGGGRRPGPGRSAGR